MEQIPDPSTPEPFPPLVVDNPPDGSFEAPSDRNESGENSSIVRAAAILAAGNVASRIMGLAREIVKANLFGSSPLLAAYQAAAYVPTSLFDLIIGGMVNSSLVPVFSDYAARERRDELWQVVSMVLSAATLILLAVVAVVLALAPQVAWLVGTVNFTEPELSTLSVSLIRLTTPAVLFLGIASILTGALYALKRFTLPAFVGAAFNGAIVIVALLNPEEIRGLVWGLLLGSLLQVLLQLPALRDAKLRWTLNLQHPAIRRIIKLYIPILAGLVVNQLAIMLSYNLAIRTGDQSLNYMNYATTLYQFPLGLVVTALSIATLPTLSRQAAGDLIQFKQTLGDGLRLVLALILPATTGLFALAPFIIGLLFEHGRFTALDTATTALVLRVYLLGMPFAAADQMLVFASYARKDTWRPALVGFVSIIIYSITALLLLGRLGLLSLMVADAVKHVVHTIIMLWILRRQLGNLAGNPVLFSAIKSLAAALLTGLAAYGAARLVAGQLDATPLVMRLSPVIAGGIVGVLAYTAAVFALNITETRALPRLLLRRR
ncbi:MAG: murein biosynthesis integral membrane protein MurJ [Anaerolineae bacterium]|nr:murein biosynthesis integral membrane protein MurJ [Anaerolineales bacterium]MCB8936661.1 murein biosynthesis integral membrane protein MurJ [Promineifilum sp.]MCW5846717.1 murein biosynthesis integral membrane protein MurJ [Anaerolineae bacterium]